MTGPAKRRSDLRPQAEPSVSWSRPAPRKVFLTGATGYLGSAIAVRLLRTGCEVRALARTQERAAAVEALGAEAVLGSFDEPEALVAEMKNCDAVVHTAYDSERAESH